MQQLIQQLNIPKTQPIHITNSTANTQANNITHKQT